jgi:hypothetical protein
MTTVVVNSGTDRTGSDPNDRGRHRLRVWSGSIKPHIVVAREPMPQPPDDVKAGTNLANGFAPI